MTQLSPDHAALIVPLLRERDGKATKIDLLDGRACTVFNIAWGRDEGEDWEHITTNISPFLQGTKVDFFLTREVAAVTVPETGHLLWTREATTGGR